MLSDGLHTVGRNDMWAKNGCSDKAAAVSILLGWL